MSTARCATSPIVLFCIAWGGVISHNIMLIPNNSQTTLRAVPFVMSTNEDY